MTNHRWRVFTQSSDLKVWDKLIELYKTSNRGVARRFFKKSVS
jgi:hypothetical protein